MDITQADRDQLRKKQHNLNPRFTIGNLVEHKTQDPKQYKKLSISHEEASASNEPDKFKIDYKSKYLPSSISPISTIKEDRDLEVPITSEEVQANMWLNMDQVEFEKLEWMTSKAEKLYHEQIKGTTRFDKNGRVIRSNLKPAKNGDDGEENEGHDLDSLVKLLDSTYPPQVVYGLNVITKIADYATMGYYDGIFGENIHQLLLKNCLLRTRHQLDSANETICQSAIKCLRALVCNSQVDEVILDRIFPIVVDPSDPNLWLQTIEMASQEFTIGMKDIECVEIDAILALVERTPLLTKFTYLLNTKIETSYYNCILDILIRIARHSPRLACMINRKELMTIVIEKFLPKAITSANENIRSLSTKALKLIRIIVEAIMDCEKKQQPIPIEQGASNKLPSTIPSILSSYLEIDCLGSITNGMNDLFKLHLETIRCVKSLSLFRQFRGDVVSMIAMIRDKLYVSFQALSKLESTQELRTKISFDWQYAAHLIDLIGSRNREELNHPSESMKSSIWNLFAKPILFRWINDIIKEKIVPHIDVSIAIVTTLKHFRERSERDNNFELRNQIINPILKSMEENGTRSSNVFKILARSASEKSQLPNYLKTSGRLRDPSNLPSYGWLQFNSDSEYQFRLDPLFEIDSPFLLLDVFINQLNDWNTDTPEALNLFLGVDTMRYLRSISGYRRQPMKYETSVQQSFAAQFEIHLVVKILLLMSKCYVVLPEAVKCPDLDTRLQDSQYEHRKEDYGNICYYAISTIGLIYDNEITNLKDELLRKVILKAEIQEKTCVENLTKPNGRQLVNFHDGEISDLCFKSTVQHRIISLIYNCCIPVDRFWIFQPILLYYVHVIKESAQEGQINNMRNPKWLVENMPWRERDIEIQSKGDAFLLSVVLNFNYKLMEFSSAYKDFTIAPNMEDYMCMVGVLFLHDDIFLDGSLSVAITANLKSILDSCLKEGTTAITSLFKDASRVIATFELPLADFFNRLVDQYESVSYGDIAFTNFLLLFLSPHSDRTFKKKLFQDKLETCIRQLRIGVSEVWALESVHFSQKESDTEIRDLYRRAKGYTLKGTFLHDFLEFHTS